jgi:hypothetical protein
VGRGTGVNGDDLVVRERRTSRGLHAGYDGMWTAKTIPGQSFFMVVVWGNFFGIKTQNGDYFLQFQHSIVSQSCSTKIRLHTKESGFCRNGSTQN